MKNIHEVLNEVIEPIIELSEDVYRHPELGFKEFRTREKVIEQLKKFEIPYEDAA